jgi:ASC-1-like (ASCH) protein
MTHQMRLQTEPFIKIKEGTKTIEVRINDEKRRQLAVGDIIEFSSRETPENTISVRVVALLTYSSFQELFQAFSPSAYGANSATEYESMYQYYSREEEREFGVVGIQFELLKT